jgi:long-subunit fatty acid transport protein
MDDDMGAYVTDADYEPGITNSEVFSNNYDLKTPGKFVLSAAAVLGNKFIASADYELVDYSKMKLMVPSGASDDADWYGIDNEYISMDFKQTSTVKLGMEYRFIPQFSGRLGYAWMQNPYETEFRESGIAAVAGSNTIYRMEGDTHYFTGGLGYRFSRNFFLDLAVVYKTQTDDLYPFPNLWTENREELVIDATPFTLKNQSIRGLITLGYKF